MLEKDLKKVIDGVYPFHMPGHKRQKEWLEGLYELDLTEITGADNLHNPDGIIAECQATATKLYKTKKTFLLTGGSTSGIHSAISAVCETNNKIIIARNCHKAVYNSVTVNRLDVSYVYPQAEPSLDCYGKVTPRDIAEEMDRSGAKAVVITSPTYEGIVSDIEGIAKEVHRRGGILVVDSAHGAHLDFNDYFPKSARSLGADIVIESAHKTLPCLTGAALLHLCTDAVTPAAIRRAIGIYLTSSPPYPILCSLDRFIGYKDKQTLFASYVKRLGHFYTETASLKGLKIIKPDDPSKIIISCKGTNINGFELKERLFKEFDIELEMAMPSYALAMTSVADTDEGFARLLSALTKISATLSPEEKKRILLPPTPKVKRPLTEKRPFSCEILPLWHSAGRTSADYVYAYPPGCPIVAPGEEITAEILEYIDDLSVCGAQIFSDGEFFPEFISVFREKD